MEELLLDIIRALREQPDLDARGLVRIINAHSNRLEGERRFAKKQLLPFYQRVKAEEPARWKQWDIDEDTERRFVSLVQMKPRRTASGVATITVITKPWSCSGNCVFCPCDVRMPKSYLHAEPACQRAERNWFDPYLQVTARLHTLGQMGHPTDKVELIVLGGTFDDYPERYRLWFMHELFRALNDCEGHDAAPQHDTPELRRKRYQAAGIARDDDVLAEQTACIQDRVTAGDLTFSQAIDLLYRKNQTWNEAARWQESSWEELELEQRRNERAAHRCVGLVVETRPALATPGNLLALRRMGCTKVQVGVQSLDEKLLAFSGRATVAHDVRRTFELLRLFGFKIHSHFMVNLPGATPQRDRADYERFVHDEAFQPDEVKLYPCALIQSAPLARMRGDMQWEPYDEDTLVGVLADDVRATPPFTRISRMIRDFSAQDIVAGNKKTNLRQMVEERLRASGAPVHEIRYREIGTHAIDATTLTLEDVAYRTTATEEHFLQWVTPEGNIAGFLRLSLPRQEALAAWQRAGANLPIGPREAMIREVHVYGRVARLHATSEGAQHLGLGRQLIARAADIARNAGYEKLNVISAVGTREYYRAQDFADTPYYQQLAL